MPMYDPVHPGELIRESLQDVGRPVAECAERIGVARNTLSRLLNGRIGVSAEMALSLEHLGWSTAEHWLRLQANYDLAQARLKEAAA